MTPEEKINNARGFLLTADPFYGHFALNMKWRKVPADSLNQSIGISVDDRGSIICSWNPVYVSRTKVSQISAMLKHVVEHVLRLHITRRAERNKKCWDLAADMTINGTYSCPKCAVMDVLPDDKDKMVWVPNGWSNGETAENYYKLIIENLEKSDGSGDSEMEFIDPIDFHDDWCNNEMSNEQVRQIVATHANNAAQRSQGSIPGNIAEILESLNTPVINWNSILRHYVGRSLGNSRKTYSRQNRRYQQFGIKGISRHGASTVTVIVDVSGSISKSELEQFFGEIEGMTRESTVNILQWDSGFQGFTSNYRRGDWHNITINGRGGTDMAAPMKWLLDNDLYGDIVVMLTDGYANWSPNLGLPYVCCITQDNTTKPDWGLTIRMRDLITPC